MTMSMRLKSILAAGFIAAASAGLAPAFAQTTPAATLGEVLNRIRQDTEEQSQEAAQREAEFRRERDRQASLLAQAEAELAALVAEGDRLNGLFEQNDARIQVLQDELRAGQGDFGELFGVARQAALDISGQMAASNIAVQPGLFTQDDGSSLIERLNGLSEAERLPSRLELDAIWKTLTQEMIHQREVVTFQARVANIGSGGTTAEVPVTRIGPFTLYAMDGGSARFVNIVDGQITVLPRQPAERLRAAAAAVARTDPGRLVAGPVDPSSGTLLGLIVDSPTPTERVNQGGIVGYVTITLMLIGVAFGLLRIFQLFVTNAAVRGQARSARAGKGNPLGRIMLAAEDARAADIETFELKLDDAIIRESSGLDFGLNFLKLAAGIAPLLGLLGTVTGMIQVFQQITLFGTGDPRIMADGISQALVTTVLGLVAAIPLLLIHSFCSSASRGVQQVLEEQSAGIVARHAESRRGGRA
jgi:biopolymer transport protein ExbB